MGSFLTPCVDLRVKTAAAALQKRHTAFDQTSPKKYLLVHSLLNTLHLLTTFLFLSFIVGDRFKVSTAVLLHHLFPLRQAALRATRIHTKSQAHTIKHLTLILRRGKTVHHGYVC